MKFIIGVIAIVLIVMPGEGPFYWFCSFIGGILIGYLVSTHD